MSATVTTATHALQSVFARHCPPGCRFRLNLVPDILCFDCEGEAREWAADVLHLPPDALILVAGHYSPEGGAARVFNGKERWTLRRGGYLVFQRPSP